MHLAIVFSCSLISHRFASQIADTHLVWSWQGSVSLERKLEEVEVGRVIVKEGVQVPCDGVLLIKRVVCDMLRDGGNCFGRRTMLHLGLEPSKM